MASATAPQPVYEVHIAADTIDASLIDKVQADGFKPNVFAEHYGVQESAYRATLKNPGEKIHTPVFTDETFDEYTGMLVDNGFRGTLIHEITRPEEIFPIKPCNGRPIPEIPLLIPTPVVGTEQKASDVHISIPMQECTDSALEYLDSLGIPAVERAHRAKRIYTLTTESYEDGVAIGQFFAEHLQHVPGLRGKVVVEQMLHYFRTLDNDGVLPIVLHEAAVDFLASV